MKSVSQEARYTERQKLVEAQESSGLTQKEFCIQHGLVLSQFVYYRALCKKIKSSSMHTNPVSSFTPIKVVSNEPRINPADIRITLPNGFSCQIPHDYSPERVRHLMQALLSC